MSIENEDIDVKSKANEEISDAQMRREARHRRRVINQVLAFSVLFLVVAAVIVGAVFGVKTLVSSINKSKAENEVVQNQQEAEQPESETQETIDELLGGEDKLEAPSVEDFVPAMTPEEKLDEIVKAAVSSMPLEDKVAGLFFVTPEGLTGVKTATKAGDGTKAALSKMAVGGIIYHTYNITSEQQFIDMLSTTQTYVNYPTFFAVTEEGGANSDVVSAGIGDKIASAKEVSESGDSNMAYMNGLAVGSKLARLGLNVDFAPVADLSSADKSIMKDRSYGTDALGVSNYVNAMSLGLKESGVNYCLKYFPGQGDLTSDPAKARVSSSRSKEDFMQNEIEVYKSAIEAGANMIMISNAVIPSLDESNIPCSLSSAVVTDLLRGEVGYNGVIISGNLSDATISTYYGADEAAIMALKAGCDMLQCPEKLELAYSAVLDAVNSGVISEERINDALCRIYRIKYADKALMN